MSMIDNSANANLQDFSNRMQNLRTYAEVLKHEPEQVRSEFLMARLQQERKLDIAFDVEDYYRRLAPLFGLTA